MLTLLLLLACAGKDQDSGPADTGAPAVTDTSESANPDTEDTDTEVETQDTAADYCDDVPTVTYESFGRGFLTGNCQGCHASTTADRYGAPEEVTFDTVDEVWAQAEAVLSAATPYDGNEPDMPPQGGVTEDDQTRLEWWLRCADPGT